MDVGTTATAATEDQTYDGDQVRAAALLERVVLVAKMLRAVSASVATMNAGMRVYICR